MALTNMAFLRDRFVVCLEATMDPVEMAWEAAYCLFAEQGGNRSLMLYGGQEREPGHKNFTYPARKFDGEMARLGRVLGRATP